MAEPTHSASAVLSTGALSSESRPLPICILPPLCDGFYLPFLVWNKTSKIQSTSHLPLPNGGEKYLDTRLLFSGVFGRIVCSLAPGQGDWLVSLGPSSLFFCVSCTVGSLSTDCPFVPSLNPVIKCKPVIGTGETLGAGWSGRDVLSVFSFTHAVVVGCHPYLARLSLCALTKQVTSQWHVFPGALMLRSH